MQENGFCCTFKKIVTLSQRTLRSDYEELALEYGACESCRLAFGKCGNPYGEQRHPSSRKLIVEVDDSLVKKDPVFSKCKFVCAYCVNRAHKERRRRKEDRILMKRVKKKIKSNLVEMGLSAGNVQRGFKQIMSIAEIRLKKLTYSNKPKEDWCTIEEIVEKVENCDMELSPEPLTLRKKLCEENKTVKLINSNTNEEIAKENSSCFQKEINLDVITSSNILNVKSSTDNLKYSFKVDLIKRRHSLPTIIAPQHKKKPRLQSLESTSSSFFTIDEKLNQDTCIIQTPKLSSNVPEEKSFDENLNSNKSISNEVPELECNDLENRPFTSIRDKIHNLHKGLSSTLKQKVKRKISDESLNEFISKKNKAEKIYNEALCNIVDSSVKKPSIKILSIENYNQNNANENKSFNISSSMCQKKPKTKCNIFNFNKSSCNNSSMDVTPSLIDDKLSSALPSPPISIDGKESEKEEIQFNNMPVKVSSVIIDYSKLGSVLPSPVDTDFDCSNDSIDANKLTINENDHYNNISSVTEAKDGEKEEIEQSKDSQTDDDHNISQLNHKNSPLENSSRAPSPDSQGTVIKSHKLPEENFKDSSYPDSTLEGYQEGDLIYAELDRFQDLNYAEDDYDVIYNGGDDYYNDKAKKQVSDQVDETVIKNEEIVQVNQNYNKSHESDSDIEIEIIQVIEKQSSNNKTSISKKESEVVLESCNKEVAKESLAAVTEKSNDLIKTKNSCHKEVAKESLAAVIEKSNDLIKTKNSCHKEVAKESFPAVTHKSNDPIKTKNSNEISEKIFLINEGRANQHIDIEDLIISSCEMQESDGFDILIEESPAMSEFFDLCSLTVNDRTFEPSLNNNRISQLQKLSEYFENIDSLEKYYMFVESKMQDEVVQNNLFNKEVQTVNELLTTLINDSCNVEEIIENYETVDTDILHTKLCAIQNLKVNNSLLKQLSLNFIDADNSSHTHNKNTTDQNTNKTLLDSVINTTADNTLPNIPSLSLKVRNLSELVEKPNRVTAENTDKTSQLKETMDNNTIEITLPPQYQANPIIIQQPLQPTQPSILQSIQQPILHLIQQPVQQPIQQILNMITKAVPQHALQANTILRPPIVNTQQPIPPKNTTSTSSSSSDINKSPNQNKPVMLFASKMFENIESTSPTSTSRIDQNPLTVYQLELPPYEKLKKLRIPSPFKVGREENFSQLNFKLSAYKKLLLDKIKSCLYNLDRKKFKSNAQDLLHQNVITEDTWRFQSSILSIAQCITRIHNLCVFSTTDITINAIMNSEQLESMKSFISTDVLKNILTVYDKLEKKGIFSSNVINQCPLYEELPQPEQDQFTQKVKSKFEKMMWTQAEQYKKIHDETAKQLQKLQNKNSSLQKKPLDQKNILPTSKNKSKEKKSQQSESFLSNNSVSGEIDISSKCLKCGKQTEIVCNNCKNAAYCSRECQNEHWNEEHHKKCK